MNFNRQSAKGSSSSSSSPSRFLVSDFFFFPLFSLLIGWSLVYRSSTVTRKKTTYVMYR